MKQGSTSLGLKSNSHVVSANYIFLAEPDAQLTKNLEEHSSLFIGARLTEEESA